MQNGYEGQTTQEAKDNRMLDYALEQRKLVTDAIDYIDIALTIPMDDEAHGIITQIKGILAGRKH